MWSDLEASAHQIPAIAGLCGQFQASAASTANILAWLAYFQKSRKSPPMDEVLIVQQTLGKDILHI